jgi:quinol-cytochrome oxidoreductase complex cytochrome b subunit
MSTGPRSMTPSSRGSRPSFFLHLHPPTIPWREARFRYTFGLGGLAVFLFLSLILTGALELFYYVPSAEGANASLQTLTFLVPFGWLVRALHFWAAQGLVVVCLLHMLRVVLTGSYKPPRAFNWVLGAVLLVVVLFLDFTGYALRWDDRVAWAVLVGTNLIGSIPGIGPMLHATIVGGAQLGAATIVRFYAWHIFGLALPGFGVLVWHLFRIRRDGGISRPESDRGDRTESPGSPAPRRISRSELLAREVLAALVATIALVALSLVAPPGLGGPIDLAKPPPEATAPWFFIWVQRLLRLGDPVVLGVGLPILLLVLLISVPFVLDRSRTGVAVWFNREGRLAQAYVLLTVVLLVGLTLWGILSP